MVSNGATNADHYLDDYITFGASGTSECSDNLNIMIATCNDLGFSLNPSKISEPNTVMEYLGIVLDTDLLQARISADRLAEVLTELNQWHHRQTATKRQVLSLIGKLSFVSRVVRPGRTFIRRMISLALPTSEGNTDSRNSPRCGMVADIPSPMEWRVHVSPKPLGSQRRPASLH